MTSAVNVEMTFRTPSGAEERVKIDAGNGKADDSSFQTWKQGEEPPKPAAGSYVYSGRHDHGVLLPPRGGQSATAQLIAVVQQAKDASNAYWTQIIEYEKAAEQAATDASSSPPLSTTTEPSLKRTKVDDTEDAMQT